MNTETTRPSRKTVATYGKVTLYSSGMFGFRKQEVRDLTIEVGPYAQYAVALHVRYTPKGARTARGFVAYSYDSQTVSPAFVIVEGHGRPNVVGALDEQGDGSSVSRYSSCDPRWSTDFAAWLAASGMVVAFEARTAADITSAAARIS